MNILRRAAAVAALVAITTVFITTTGHAGRADLREASTAALNSTAVKAFVTCDFHDIPIFFRLLIDRCWVRQSPGVYRINCVAKYSNGVPVCIRSYIYNGEPGDATDLPTCYGVFDQNHDDEIDCAPFG